MEAIKRILRKSPTVLRKKNDVREREINQDTINKGGRQIERERNRRQDEFQRQRKRKRDIVREWRNDFELSQQMVNVSERQMVNRR